MGELVNHKFRRIVQEFDATKLLAGMIRKILVAPLPSTLYPHTIYMYTLTIIGLVVRRQTGRQAKIGNIFLHNLGIMNHQENMKVAIRRMETITQYLSSLRSGNKNVKTVEYF